MPLYKEKGGIFHLAEHQDDSLIDMQQTTEGCKENCLHCGYFSVYPQKQKEKVMLDEKTIIEYLTRKIEGTEKYLYDFLHPSLTTHVNAEPLRQEIFLKHAEIIYCLTDAKSKLLCISHGVREKIMEMYLYLENIALLLEQNIVPLFVLSVDKCRNKGKISEKKNIESYYQTLLTLKPLIKEESRLKENYKKGRVRVSIQGDPDSKSPLYIGNSEQIFKQVSERLGLNNEEIETLLGEKRHYSRVGSLNGKDLLVTENEDCPVIPYRDFVVNELFKENKYRLLLDLKGDLYYQRNNWESTYGDSCKKGNWLPVSFTAK